MPAHAMQFQLIDKLARQHALSQAEYERLLEAYIGGVADKGEANGEGEPPTPLPTHAAAGEGERPVSLSANALVGEQGEARNALAAYAAQKARAVRQEVYGNQVYARGLIEISNFCKNDCLYCGIRKSNAACQRYRLTPQEILTCCKHGYDLGFRTFVLQGGEDPLLTDAVLVPLVRAIKAAHPDCAVTLSLGERPRESYRALREAGADRYLLRHETANPAHYAQLHPPSMSHANRVRCLRDLKDLGFQTGCGFMVGSPGQTIRDLAQDLVFIQEFQPEMCGIGPFIPHAQTPFASQPAGSVGLTCFLLSLVRLACPAVLLPATTALGSLAPDGREQGILAGANVVMPNLSPQDARGKYQLYNNKLATGAESAEHLMLLAQRLEAIGHRLVLDRGDALQSRPDLPEGIRGVLR